MNSLLPRSNDILGNLAPDLRAQLDQWILAGETYPKICDRLAKLPPDGPGIDVSTSTISRYRQRRLLAVELAEADEALSQLRDPRASLRNLLEQSALTAALDAELPPSTFQILARYYRVLRDDHFKQRSTEQRDQELQIARERLAHQRRVFEFNSARAALVAVADLKQIFTDTKLDVEQKVLEARKVLFGVPPGEQPPKPLNEFV